MTTQTTTKPVETKQTTKPVADLAEPKRERRSWSTGLVDPAGARLEIRLERRRDGSWRTLARHVVGSGKVKKISRGASETHADERSARATLDKLTAVAVKAGWTVKASRAGFAARPDAFDAAHLPAPSKPTKNVAASSDSRNDPGSSRPGVVVRLDLPWQARVPG